VSKADLVDLVAIETGLTKKDVKTVLDSFFENTKTQLEKGVKVQLTGFGTFEVRERRERLGVRPGTTDQITIPASKYPAFKPGKDLKENIK
jgi:DNA-binding protein HU-beta